MQEVAVSAACCMNIVPFGFAYSILRCPCHIRCSVTRLATAFGCLDSRSLLRLWSRHVQVWRLYFSLAPLTLVLCVALPRSRRAAWCCAWLRLARPAAGTRGTGGRTAGTAAARTSFPRAACTAGSGTPTAATALAPWSGRPLPIRAPPPWRLARPPQCRPPPRSSTAATGRTGCHTAGASPPGLRAVGPWLAKVRRLASWQAVLLPRHSPWTTALLRCRSSHPSYTPSMF